MFVFRDQMAVFVNPQMQTNMYFNQKTTYYNRKFDIVDYNNFVIVYIFLIWPVIYIKYSIFDVK